jgi:hypothetical protein
VARFIGSVEWQYHGHPYQPKAEIQYCQYQSRLADKVSKPVLR